MLLTATRAPNLNGFHHRDVAVHRVNHAVPDYPSTPPRQPPAADSPPPLPSRSGSFVSQSSRRSGVVSELDAMRLMTALDSAGRSGSISTAGADWNLTTAATTAHTDRRPRHGDVMASSSPQQRGTSSSYWATPVPARRVPAEADHRRFQLQQQQQPSSSSGGFLSSPQRQMSASTAADQPINCAGVQHRGVWKMVGQQRSDLQSGISGSTLRQNSLSSSSSTMGSNASLHQPSAARSTPPPLPPPPASRTVRDGPPRAVLQQQQQQEAMERQLAERDAELRSVRVTMDNNEQAILRAMDDQRRIWESKAAEREAIWERRMKDVEEQAAGQQSAMEDRIRRLELENASTKTWRQLERLKQNDRLTEHRRPRPAGQAETETESEGKLYPSISAMDRNNNRVSNEIDRNATTVACGARPLKPHPVNGTVSSTTDRGLQPGGSSPAGVSSSSSSNLSGRLFSVTAATHSSESDDSLVGSVRGSHGARRHRRNKDDGCRTAMELTSTTATVITSGYGGVDARSRDCCAAARDELDRCRRQFDDERQRWTSEKASVVAYQKRLQGAYLELVRRCSAFEDRLREAGLLDPLEDGRLRSISDDPEDQFRVRRWDSMTLERVGLDDVVPRDRIY